MVIHYRELKFRHEYLEFIQVSLNLKCGIPWHIVTTDTYVFFRLLQYRKHSGNLAHIFLDKI